MRDVTLNFLLFCTRQLAHRPVLLLLTYRSDEVGPGLGRLLAALDRERLASEMPLVRLSQQETTDMVGAIFGLTRAPQVDFVEALYALTDGNPFFVEEVLKTCVTEGAIFQLGGHWGRKPLSQLQIPGTVQVAVQQRVAHLTPPAREVLALAAVIGQQWRFDLLQDVSECDEHALVLLLKERIAAQIIIEEAPDRFAFRHALTRQTICNTLPALAVARTLGDPSALGSTLNRVGNWHVNMDDPRTGQRYLEEALAIFQQPEDKAGVEGVLDLQAVDAQMCGDLPLGMTLYTQAAQRFRAAEDRRGLTSSLSWLTFQGPTALNVMAVAAPLAHPTLPLFAPPPPLPRAWSAPPAMVVWKRRAE